MRRAIIIYFFVALIIQKEGATDSDFRPIPIPLDQWHYEKREARVGTLHEAIKTDKPTTVAAVPAHYWEDALRHSVYLTLVRDKIDQLITKGIVVSPNKQLDPHVSKEVDDRDLWEKIKQAPFDRIEEGDHTLLGDVTIMAKGRLLEENSGYRFTEDEQSKEDCKEDGCMEGVKAFWSVKRVRQRDDEISPGRYHYELTFSVNSQPPKKQRKPHETPVRTFTVRENSPEVVAHPKENPFYQTPRPQAPRPQRAVWFHKNIAPLPQQNQARYHHQGLDRIFSSFFSDDDTHVEPSPRYKPTPYMPPIYPQFSKLGYVGQPSDQHQQKRFMQYPYKPNMYKYPRPPLQAPPLSHGQHHYVDMEAMSHNPYGPPPPDHRYLSPSNIVKTTRPAVLPTPPVPSLNATANETTDFYNDNQANVTENVTSQPELPPIYKTYNKPRPPPTKMSYYPERLRPPIYNAPPGVFLTMEKKPFKPMPPLKYMHGSKPVKRPVDFRPSPQVLDVQFSDPDTTVESAFRPILVNFTETDETEKTDSSYENKQSNKHIRKSAVKKPPKKHENIKSHRITTSAPDIITVQGDIEEDDNDTISWANILGAFTKTTPMDPQKDTEKVYETTTEPMAPSSSTLAYRRTTESNEEKTITTTVSPVLKKRTRPPHKFVKPEKVKKHKRITTTTKAPEKVQIKKTADLTLQASSAATGGNKPWQPKNKTVTITTTSTTTSTTTQKPLTSTAQVTTASITSITTPLISTTIETETINKDIDQKNKNRFRQSTLMIKGTSVKHDRWSVNATTEKKVTASTIGKYPPRRKGSNFQGYGATTASKYSSQEQFTREHAKEHSKMADSSTASDTAYTPPSTQSTYEETADRYINSKSTEGYSQNEEEYEEDHDDIEVKVNDDQESEDHAEFIFDLTSTAPNDKSNEINEEDLIVTEQSIVTTSHSVSKNRTKCKKKKHQHLTPTQQSITDVEDHPTTSTNTTQTPTTKSPSDLDILDELMGSLNNYDESTAKPEENKPSELDEEESENNEKYIQIDEDFEDFLDNIGNRKRHSDDEEDEEYEDDDKEPSFDDDDSPFDNDDVNEPSRNTSDKDYDEYHDRSYSLLELMAME